MDVTVCKYTSMGIFLEKAFLFLSLYLLSIFFAFLLHDLE